MENRPHRTLAVTIVAVGVFLLSAGNFVLVEQTLLQYENLRHLPLSVPPWYFLLGGAAWGCIWLAAGTGLWRRREWGRRLALAAIPLQFIAWIADRWLLDRSSIAAQSFGFDFALRLALVITAVFILLRTNRTPSEFGS